MVGWILKKVIGSKNQREIKRMMPIVRRINELDEQFKTLSDDELRAKTAQWQTELAQMADPNEQWQKLDQILPEAFAVVKNGARRLTEMQHSFTVSDQPMTWNMVHFDVQLVGGMVLHRGRIAEMATGEGKTLVATLPLYLNALTGRGANHRGQLRLDQRLIQRLGRRPNAVVNLGGLQCLQQLQQGRLVQGHRVAFL